MPVQEKTLQSPQHCLLALKSGQEVSTPSIMREKVVQDGYNWRKYGQKLVKGNEYVRSYYRCTNPNCQVKKQLECSHSGQIVDIVYFGHHDHPKPQLNNDNIPVAVGFVMSTAEERRKEPSLTTVEVVEHSLTFTKSERGDSPPVTNIAATASPEGTISQSNKIKDCKSDDDPVTKRRKKDKHDHKAATVAKPTSEPRLVVHTRSEVDIMNDGHRWRKYGQKIVKGSPHPRFISFSFLEIVIVCARSVNASHPCILVSNAGQERPMSVYYELLMSMIKRPHLQQGNKTKLSVVSKGKEESCRPQFSHHWNYVLYFDFFHHGSASKSFEVYMQLYDFISLA